jgi:hypothetical protein
MPVLRRTSFVRAVEVELQRRGFVQAVNLPGNCEWRRASMWRHPEFRLRVEIRAGHELRLRFPDGHWQVVIAKDWREVNETLDVGESHARFGDD